MLSEFTTFFPFTFTPVVTVTLADLAYWLTVILVAPTLIVAWTEPDAPAEEVPAAPNV